MTIYKGQNRRATIYTVAFQWDGPRQRQMRRSFEDAFALAKEIVLKMAAGAGNRLTLDGRARFSCGRAMELAAPTGMELDALIARAV